MPGIDVSDNGTISFKGKTIEKILLDDTDLFDKNYTIASKNVPANFIDKIQAIEKYHDNRLLKDVENSDKIVLNLSVRDDLKMQRPVGQLYASGGYENRYSLQPNLLSMNKKLKLFDVLNMNNTSSSSSLGTHFNTLYGELESYTDAYVVNSSFMSYNDGDIERAETRHFFNSLNFVYQPVNRLQITGNILFNQTRQSFTDNTRIFYFPDSLLIENTSHIRKKPQTIYGMLRMKYDVKENILLTYSGKYNILNQSETNNLFIPEAGLYNISGRNQFLMNDLEMTIAFRDSSALVFRTLLLSNRSSQDFNYSLLENSYPEIEQTTQSATSQYNVLAKYYNKNRDNFFYTLEASLNRNKQDMNVNEMIQNETGKAGALDDASFLVNADLTYKIRTSSFSFQSGIGYRKQQINVSDSICKNDRRFEYSPRLSYQLTLGQHRFSLSGNYTQGKFSLLDYMDYFTDYRNRKFGTKVYTYGSTIGYSVSYLYSGPLLQPFFFISYVIRVCC